MVKKGFISNDFKIIVNSAQCYEPAWKGGEFGGE